MGSPETDRFVRAFTPSLLDACPILPDGSDGNSAAEYCDPSLRFQPWSNPQNASKSEELTEEAASRRVDLSNDDVVFSQQNLQWLLDHREPDSDSE